MEQAVIAGYPIVLPDHRAAFHREHPDWHKSWLDSIHKHLRPDDVVIDVGAEQGDLSALIASWVPDGGIVLVEPQPLFWPTIRETFEANGLKPLATFVGFASRIDSLRGDQFPSAYWPAEAIYGVVTDPGFYHLNEQSTARLMIDDLADEIAPSVLLIDTEGSELLVLQGAYIKLSTCRPQVWCAIHPEIMSIRYGHDANDLLAFMHRLGYQWELLGFAGEIHVRFYVP